MTANEQIIAQTKKWVTDVVIACNFCPFAAKEVKQNKINYQVEEGTGMKPSIEAFLSACVKMDNDGNIETTLMIFSAGFSDFHNYLNLVALAEKALRKKGYEGTYQVASFHPDYCFAGANYDDAANYTNRSIYPMLHLIREESIEAAMARYEKHEDIPERNINFARAKGTTYMKMLRDSCL